LLFLLGFLIKEVGLLERKVLFPYNYKDFLNGKNIGTKEIVINKHKNVSLREIDHVKPLIQYGLRVYDKNIFKVIPNKTSFMVQNVKDLLRDKFMLENNDAELLSEF
jgi:hypothetical protein